MIVEYYKKNILIKLYIIFSFCICWLSISTTFNDLFIFSNDKEINIKLFVNFLRQAFIYICFFFSFFIILFVKKNFFKKEKLIYLFFGIYFLAQIPGLIFSENKFENIYLIISSLTAILTIILIEEFFSKDEKKIFIYICFCILSIVLLLNFIPQVKLYIEGQQNFYGGLTVESEIFFGKDSPRSSGSSRTCLILIILLFILEKNLFKKKKFFSKSLTVLLLSFILLYQSRTIIFTTMIIFSFIFIYENDFSLKKIIKFIAIYLIIPFLIFTISINFYANQKYEFIKKYIEKEKISKLEKSMKIDKLEKRIILRKFSDFSSGRFEDWKNIYNEFSNKNIFFGYGSQADRYLINQSASNGLIYALISSGIFGFIFFILFSLIVLKKISIYIINFKQTDYINYFFSLLILSIFLRSLLETSYSVYGIDFMIAITAICFINNFETKN